MMYEIKFLRKAIKELEKIDKAYQKIIKGKLLILAQDPEVLKNNIKKLSDINDDIYRLRVGSYRVVFQKKDRELIILVVRIGHRKEIFHKL